MANLVTDNDETRAIFSIGLRYLSNANRYFHCWAKICSYWWRIDWETSKSSFHEGRFRSIWLAEHLSRNHWDEKRKEKGSESNAIVGWNRLASRSTMKTTSTNTDAKMNKHFYNERLTKQWIEFTTAIDAFVVRCALIDVEAVFLIECTVLLCVINELTSLISIREERNILIMWPIARRVTE